MKTRLVIPLLTLLALAAMIGLQRLHTLNEPLERDLTLYAVFGHELLAGRSLYSDLCENKPPAVFLTYAAAEWLAGYGPAAIFLLGVVPAIITLLGVYRAGMRLSNSTATGLWAALFWTAICSDLSLEANQPNTEVFINACVIWSFVLLLKSDQRRSGWGRYVVIGLLLAVASLYKTVVIAVAAALCGGHLLFPRGEPPERARSLKQVGVMIAAVATAWALVFGYFAAAGHLKDFYAIVFEFNRYYAGSIAKNLGLGLIRFKGFLTSLVPFIYASCVWAVMVTSGESRRPWLLLAGLAVGSHLAVALPGKWYPHYYQYWLPVIAVAAAWSMEEWGRLAGRHSKWVKSAAGSVILLVLGLHAFSNFYFSPQEWSRKKYGEIFLESKEMGEEIGRMLKPGETFYEWGAESGLYYYSRMSPPSGVLFYWHLAGLPGWPGWPGWSHSEVMFNRVVEDLERAQPELFLVSERVGSKVIFHNPLLSWFSTRYRPFSLQHSFILFARQGGRLERRLADADRPAGGDAQALARGDEIRGRINALTPGAAKRPGDMPPEAGFFFLADGGAANSARPPRRLQRLWRADQKSTPLLAVENSPDKAGKAGQKAGCQISTGCCPNKF